MNPLPNFTIFCPLNIAMARFRDKTEFQKVRARILPNRLTML